MHTIEPYYNWRNLYTAEDDPQSPFFQREYSETHYTDQIYDHYIHPQWDNIDSTTLFIKLLFTDYDEGYCIIELFGEWNDCLYNDIMFLKRDVIESLTREGINKFILIGENVLNFHSSDDCYYEELFDELEDGWMVFLNFHPHVLEEFSDANIDSYILFGEDFDLIEWRTHKPDQLFNKIETKVENRFNLPLSN